MHYVEACLSYHIMRLMHVWTDYNVPTELTVKTSMRNMFNNILVKNTLKIYKKEMSGKVVNIIYNIASAPPLYGQCVILSVIDFG